VLGVKDFSVMLGMWCTDEMMKEVWYQLLCAVCCAACRG
jgi:hypothetical protein